MYSSGVQNCLYYTFMIAHGTHKVGRLGEWTFRASHF